MDTYNSYKDILAQAKKVCCIDDKDCNELNLKVFENIVRDCILEVLIKYSSFCRFDILNQTFAIYKNFPLMHFIKVDWYIHRGWDKQAEEWFNQAYVILRKLKRRLG